MIIEARNFTNGQVAEINLGELTPNISEDSARELVREWALIHVPQSARDFLTTNYGLIGVGIISQLEAELEIEDGFTIHPKAELGFRLVLDLN